jgi:DNA-directed RNA polymerase subunit alpha
MKIDTLGDLLRITEAELLSYKNFGETSLREIKAILEPRGLYLGMELEDRLLAAADAFPAPVLEEADQGILSKPVEDLQLSVRAKKAIQSLNIRTLGDLTRKTEAELLGCKNFGVTSLNEIKKALSNFGLALRTLD